MLKVSLRSVRAFLPKLPIIIFHEDYGQQQFDELRKIFEDIQFETVDFSGGQEHFIHRPKEGGNYEQQRTYLLMCRFFCGQVQNHPAVQKYEYYMRLDDDSFFMEPRLDDFNRLLQYDYTYRSEYTDREHITLCEFTQQFLGRHGFDSRELAQRGIDTRKAYSSRGIYNNFHISRLSMWQHPLIKAYLDDIEETHGILRGMWFDSRIQAIIAWVLMPLVGLKSGIIVDFGYRHNRHRSQHNSTGDPVYEDHLFFCPTKREVEYGY